VVALAALDWVTPVKLCGLPEGCLNFAREALLDYRGGTGQAKLREWPLPFTTSSTARSLVAPGGALALAAGNRWQRAWRWMRATS
jgi:hypothetical protein